MLKGPFVDGHFELEFLHIYLTRPGAVSKNATIDPLVGIEPAAQ